MADKWRPEGWDELELEKNSALAEKLKMPLGAPSVGMVQAFEAGADAMLEAIWKMAKESPTGTFTFDTHVVQIL